jgi:hypothetical protein
MDRKACPRCGAAIDPERAGGLCPACFLNEGLTAVGRLQCNAYQATLTDDMRICGRSGVAVPAEPAAEGDPVRAALEAKLLAQYRIVRLLGRRGMGSVYLARDSATRSAARRWPWPRPGPPSGARVRTRRRRRDRASKKRDRGSAIVPNRTLDSWAGEIP